jgi:hypothetical protein
MSSKKEELAIRRLFSFSNPKIPRVRFSENKMKTREKYSVYYGEIHITIFWRYHYDQQGES